MGQLSPMETIRNTGFMGFDIMPGSQDLAGANVEMVNMKNREFKLKELVDRVKDNYDYVIIDSPPSLGMLTLNALVASDEVLIPVQCEYLALEGLGQLLETVDMINKNLNRDIKIRGAILTMYNRQNKLSQMVAKEVRRNFPGYVFDAVIPRTVVLSEVPFYGRTVLRYAPDSKASQSFRELAQELIFCEA
jgi:chromosome partitioning protein